MELSNTVSFILIAVIGAVIAISGVAKLARVKKIEMTLAKMGVAQLMPWFGIAEITFAVLLVYPPTNPIGFILCACYFSGALAADLSHKNPITPPLVILITLFSIEYITHPALFVP